MSTADMEALFSSVSNWGRWGPDDERGALNHLGEAEARAAAGLVTLGRTVSLSRDFPVQPGPENPWPAHHHMVIAGDDPCVPGIDGLEVSTDYIGIAFHGMASSHLDALCHVFQGGQMYNGHPATDVKSTGASADSRVISATRTVPPQSSLRPTAVGPAAAMSRIVAGRMLRMLKPSGR